MYSTIISTNFNLIIRLNLDANTLLELRHGTGINELQKWIKYTEYVCLTIVIPSRLYEQINPYIPN